MGRRQLRKWVGRKKTWKEKCRGRGTGKWAFRERQVDRECIRKGVGIWKDLVNAEVNYKPFLLLILGPLRFENAVTSCHCSLCVIWVIDSSSGVFSLKPLEPLSESTWNGCPLGQNYEWCHLLIVRDVWFQDLKIKLGSLSLLGLKITHTNCIAVTDWNDVEQENEMVPVFCFFTFHSLLSGSQEVDFLWPFASTTGIKFSAVATSCPKKYRSTDCSIPREEHFHSIF